MKKMIVLFTLLCGATLSALAQAPAVAEKEISLKKLKGNAYTATYSNVPEADLQATADIWMKKNLGGRQGKSNGYVMYTGAHWNDLDYGAPLTVYYKVDGNKKSSTLTLLVANPQNQFLSSSGNAQAGGKLYTFFNELSDEVAVYQKQQKINALTTTLGQQESDLKKLTEKSNSLKKQKERLDRDIAANDQELTERNNELNTTKNALQELSR